MPYSKNPATMYAILDELSKLKALDIDYDNLSSGLVSTDMQGAIDELSLSIGGGTGSTVSQDLDSVLTVGNNAGLNDIDLNGNDLLNVGALNGQNNVAITVEAKGTGSVIFRTGNTERLKITDTGAFSGLPVASANGVDRGISTFNSSDFDDNGSGVISIDYANGQSASGANKGFLTSSDWTTFNNKQAALGFTPENATNKDTDTNLGTSNTLYPTQNAVKTYVDTAIANNSLDVLQAQIFS